MRPFTERGIRAVVLDIEGTTTPIAFVHQTLFPYARTHLAGFLRDPANAPLIRDLVPRFAQERHAEPESEGAPPWREDTPEDVLNSVMVYGGWLMDRDRKSPALKTLQGHIWAIGYRDGHLRGAIFPDVPAAMKRWNEEGVTIAIYSSGSVLAQRLIFSMSDEGDLTPFISHFFDTAVGPKTSADSYRRIARELRIEPSQALFFSDVDAELDAAREAGWHVVLVVRPEHYAPNPSGYEAVDSFDVV